MEIICLNAFSRKTLGDIDHFYIGAFLGWIDESNKLRSIVGQYPTINKTLSEFRTAAQNNGDHYQIFRFSQLVLIQALLLMRNKYRNEAYSTSFMGSGITNKSNRSMTGYNINLSDSNQNQTTSNSTWNGTNKGLFVKSSSNSQHVRVFGIEDFWGNLSEWIDGCYRQNNDGIYKMFTSWNLNNNENIEEEIVNFDTPYQEQASPAGWLRTVVGTNNAGFLPYSLDSDAEDESSSYNNTGTYYINGYWGDFCYFYNSGFLKLGGDYSDQYQAGPFAQCFNSGSSEYTGARLTYV